MQHSDLATLLRIRQHRCLRAEREYASHRRELDQFAQKIEHHQDELQQLTVSCQQDRASLGREHQGVITFQQVKKWQQKEGELLTCIADKSQQITSLQQQCEEQTERVENARVAMQQRQIAMEKLKELGKLLDREVQL